MAAHAVFSLQTNFRNMCCDCTKYF